MDAPTIFYLIMCSVNATRNDFTTLEEYTERVLATMNRIEKDKTVVENTFAKAIQDIQQIKDGVEVAQNRANIKIRTLKNNCKPRNSYDYIYILVAPIGLTRVVKEICLISS